MPYKPYKPPFKICWLVFIFEIRTWFLYVSCLTYFSRLSAYEREKFHKPLPVLTVHWVSSSEEIFDAHITVVCVSVEGNAKFIRILSIKDQDRDRR